jgi:hypothetical protein
MSAVNKVKALHSGQWPPRRRGVWCRGKARLTKFSISRYLALLRRTFYKHSVKKEKDMRKNKFPAVPTVICIHIL